MQRYFAISKNHNFLVVTKEDEHHIKNVMRFKKNQKIEIVYQNVLYIAKIISLDPLMIEKTELIKQTLIQRPFTRIIIPFLKETKIDIILQKATELGVNEIMFYKAERSIIKLDDSKLAKKITRWTKICKEASEQSKRVDIPQITQLNKEFLDNCDGLSLICEPSAKQSIQMYLKMLDTYDKINILIGPEGGFSKNELSYYEKNNFVAVRFGRNILRTETVPLFLLSVISYMGME